MQNYCSPRKYQHESRYSKYRQIVENENTWLETFNSSVIPKTDDDKYHIVTTQQIGRLDLIANQYYNNPSFYWVIALANDIIDPFIIDAGTILRIPATSTLYGKDGVLNYYDRFYGRY